MASTAEIRDQWRDRGFVVYRNWLSSEQIDEIVRMAEVSWLSSIFPPSVMICTISCCHARVMHTCTRIIYIPNV